MADREAPGASARGVPDWRRVALVVGSIAVLLAAVLTGLVVGRASAPGPTLVVLPGPVVQESPAADSLSTSGMVDADTLIVARTHLVAPAVFTAAPSLDDSSTTASGFRMTRLGLDGADVATGLATVLGVDGAAHRTSEGWTIGAAGGPGLTVLDDAALSWSFADPLAAADSASGAFVIASRARNAASALLESIGVDLTSVDWQVSRFDDHLAIRAWQVVDGNRTSMFWEIGFGQGDSVVSASGFAAELVEVPGYPVVGAATAVRRAGLPTWSLLGPTPADAQRLGSIPGSTPPSASGPAGRPALEVGVLSIVVTDANLTQGEFRQPDGSLLILPAYRLTGDDGSHWTLIAVTSDYVDFIDQPYPGPALAAP